MHKFQPGDLVRVIKPYDAYTVRYYKVPTETHIGVILKVLKQYANLSDIGEYSYKLEPPPDYQHEDIFASEEHLELVFTI